MDRLTIDQAFQSARVFRDAFAGESWRAWIVALRLLYGLPLAAPEDMDLAFKTTGRRAFPATGFDEAYFGCGRGSGKSRIAAAVGVYQAVFGADWPSLLAAGERAKVLILAVDREQARIVWNYCHGLLRSSPALAALVEGETTTTISLRNQTDIEIGTSNFRSVRGRTVICAILEELAFWRSNEYAANPATEIARALRPALMRLPHSKLIGISSVYSKEGLLWEKVERHHGKDDSDVLVWVADSMTMNSTLDRRMIERELEDDPEAARAEWLSEFRSDIASFIDEALLSTAIVRGRTADLPCPKRSSAVAFADPSGGRNDSFACAVAVADPKGRVVVLSTRETRPPFDPEAVVVEFAKWLREYGITEITADRYAGEWAAEAWRRCGITPRPADLTASELYLEFLPLLTSGKVELPDNARLATQLRNLERRTRPGGRDSVSHPPGPHFHDDLANAVAGAAVLAARNAAAGEGLVFGTVEHDIRPEDSDPGGKRGGYVGGDSYERKMFDAWRRK